jgi:hypothetical protein
MTYLQATVEFYEEVAQTPDVGLCCVQSSPLQLPGLMIPATVCDKTARNLQCKNSAEILITPSTWHYNGGGCC